MINSVEATIRNLVPLFVNPFQPKRVFSKFLCLSAMILWSFSHTSAHEVISFGSGDWNNDGHLDAVVIMEPNATEEDAGIIFYLYDSTLQKLEISEKAKNFLIVSKSATGQYSTKVYSKNGKIEIRSANDSIGRTRWKQLIVVGFRHEKFSILSYEYRSRDTLKSEQYDKCEIDFVLSTKTKNGLKTAFQRAEVSVQDWSPTMAQSWCEER